MELQIDTMDNNGQGVAHYNGKKVIIPYALPGEIVKVKLIKQNSKYIQGQIERIILPSAERISPICKHYYQCGGCTLQHLNEASYLKFKREIVQNAIGWAGYESANNIEIMLMGHSNRRKVRLKVDKEIIGYYKEKSNSLVAITSCAIMHPTLWEQVRKLQAILPKINSNSIINEVILTLCDNGVDLLLNATKEPDLDTTETLANMDGEICRITWQTSGRLMPIIERHAPYIHIGDIKVTLPAINFLQVSDDSTKAIQNIVIANTQGAKTVVDLYAGCGNYSLPMCEYASVTCIEGDENMIMALTKITNANKLNLKVIKRDLFRTPLDSKEISKYDAVVINPPRNGAEPQIEQIALSKVKKVIMVSCNPSSWSRDASILRESGFSLNNTTIVDQFHWSNHIELVTVFQR